MLPPRRRNWTAPTLIGYRFEACTPDHRGSSRRTRVQKCAYLSTQRKMFKKQFQTTNLKIWQISPFSWYQWNARFILCIWIKFCPKVCIRGHGTSKTLIIKLVVHALQIIFFTSTFATRATTCEQRPKCAKQPFMFAKPLKPQATEMLFKFQFYDKIIRFSKKMFTDILASTIITASWDKHN